MVTTETNDNSYKQQTPLQWLQEIWMSILAVTIKLISVVQP